MRQAIFLLVLTAANAADLPLIQPRDLAAELAKSGQAAKPIIVQVGPNVLYRSKHIPGAVYAGPAARPAGLDLLKNTVANLPRDREIVLYCGCCPWSRCPNIGTAYQFLLGMGFKNLKALYLPNNFGMDWVAKGYKVEK